jgi:integrase/recombinase XerD
MAYRPAKKIHLIKKNGVLGEAFSRFEQDKRIQNVSHKTQEVYENTWKFFGRHLETFGEQTGTDLDFEAPSNRKAWEKRIVNLCMTAIDDRQRGERPVSPITVNVYLRVINTFLKWLKVEDEFLKFDWKIKPLEVPTGDRREIFTDEDVEALQKFKPTSFNQTRAWTISMLMLDSGVRIEEALSLTVPDIDYDGDIIRIVGKGNKSRPVPISIIKPILNRYVSKHMPKTAKYVFGTRSGRMMLQRNALRDLRVVQRKAKMTPLSWHSYRHTFGTGYLRRGGKIDKLQRIMGHADIRTTQIYLHMAKEYITEDHETYSSLMPMR